MVTVTLPDDLEAWAEAEVAAGRAKTVEGLVMETLREHVRYSATHQRLVAEAYAQVARGEVFEASEVDAELDRWITEDLSSRR